MKKKILASFILASALGMNVYGFQTPVFAATAPATPQTVTTSNQNYGVYTFFWDGTANAPGFPNVMKKLGFGWQEYYGEPQFSNTFTFQQWGSELQKTNGNGLFTFNWESGFGPSQAAYDVRTALAAGYPIKAIDIGTEDYGMWRSVYQPLRTPAYYAQSATAIAKAIKQVDPNIQVGIDYDAGTDAWGVRWSQDALRAALPYINFVSVHAYPFGSQPSNTALLSQMPQNLINTINTVKTEIRSATKPGETPPAIWMTEFSPVNSPYTQSVQPIYGAAMIEAELVMRAMGVQKIFNWGITGGSNNEQGTPVYQSGTPYGTLGLISTGNSPQPPQLTLFPSAVALSDFLHTTGNQAQEKVWIGQNAVIGEVTNSSTQQHSLYLINELGTTQTFSLNTSNGIQTVSVQPTSLKILHNTSDVQSINNFSLLNISTPTNSYQPSPVINSASSLYDGKTQNYSAGLDQTSLTAVDAYPGDIVTLQGNGFGNSQGNGYVYMEQGPLSAFSEYPQSTIWGEPNNAYKIKVLKWSNTSITFQVPSGAESPQLNEPVFYGVVTHDFRTTRMLQPMMIQSPPVASITSLSTTKAYDGESITIHGNNFGQQQGNGYLHLQQGTTNWGAPGNWYKIPIQNWSNTSITFQIPNHQTGNNDQYVPLQVGQSASIQVTNPFNGTSNAVSMRIGNPPPATVNGISTNKVYNGETVTVTGKNFGSSQGNGFITIKQGTTNWGAPGNWYKIPIQSWSDSSITFQIPNHQTNNNDTFVPLQVGVPATVQVANEGGQLSSALSLTVLPPPPSITNFSLPSVYNGETLTLSGNDFGSTQGNGYVWIQQKQNQSNLVNWGAPKNAYLIPIQSWSNSSITIQIPDHQTSNTDPYVPLQPNVPTTITVVNNLGESSSPHSLSIVSPPPAVVTNLSSTTTYNGGTLTFNGTNFGATQGKGYVWIQQKQTDGATINWGAPGNWYRIPILSWTNTSVTVQIPDHQTSNTDNFVPLQEGQPTTIAIADNLGGISKTIPIIIGNPPPAVLTQVSSQTVYNGETLTLTGTNFGSTQGKGYVWISQKQPNGSTVNWGAPGNLYKIPIQSWSDSSITIEIPNHQTSNSDSFPPLQIGLPTTLSVANNLQGLSQSMSLTVSTPPPAVLSSVSSPTIYNGETLTLSGSNFGTAQGKGYVWISQKQANGSTVNWGAPGNAYKVPIQSWTNTSITIQVPNHQTANNDPYTPLQLGLPTTFTVGNDIGGISSPLSVTVGNPPPTVITSVYDSVYNGETITMSGSNFGSVQGKGYVWIQQKQTDGATINWGAPGNWYRIPIQSWSDTQVTFQIPDHQTSNVDNYIPLEEGQPISLRIANNLGGISIPMTIAVVSPPPSVLTSVYSPSAYAGQSVTLTGSNFGPLQGRGYVWISQKQTNGSTVNWGAPGNWYLLPISSWSDTKITFVLPNHQTGNNDRYPPLTPGIPTTVAVANNLGGLSQSLPITILPTPPKTKTTS